MNSTISLEQVIDRLPGSLVLTSEQIENSSRLITISKKFSKKGKIDIFDTEYVSDRSIILESGHQPNFLPYSGIWKKGFCLNLIHEELKRNNHASFAFFGLADQNISTARILSKNQIPALNKEGLTKIGFKIQDADKFRSFNTIKKPSLEQWQTEIVKIERHYTDLIKRTRLDGCSGKKQSDKVLEILWKSYELAENFAELNAFIFAKCCTELLNFHVFFFLYSDMHKEKLFLKESTNILRNLAKFNNSYNQVIEQKNLEIPPVKTGRIPFWFECDCGVKIDIFLNDSSAGLLTCPLCNKEYQLNFSENFVNLSEYFDKMDFNAVSRNMIMANGLGDSLFISGAGGSLQYGQISDRISAELGFHIPVTLAWRSRDYYLGMAQSSAIRELGKQFSLSPDDFFTGFLNEKIQIFFDHLQGKIQEATASSDHKELKHWSGVYNNAKNQIAMVKNIFSTIPSFLDHLENLPAEEIIDSWNLALERAELQQLNNVCQVTGDIQYHTNLLSDLPSDDMSVVYRNIGKIEVG